MLAHLKGCCCGGLLDCYLSSVDGDSAFFRAQSVYPDSAIDFPASRAQWEFSRGANAAGRTAYDNCVIATRDDLVCELLEDDSDAKDWQIQVYDAFTKSVDISHNVVWGSAANPVKFSFGSTGAGATKWNVGSSQYYEFWTAAGTFTQRGPFSTTGIRATTAFSMGIDSYTAASVLDGTVALPEAVSRWEYPKAAGFRITGWTEQGRWAGNTLTVEVEWELVVGSVDWSIDGPPTLSYESTKLSYTFTGTVTSTTHTTADARNRVAKYLRGEAFTGVSVTSGTAPHGGGIATNISSTSHPMQSGNNSNLAIFEQHKDGNSAYGVHLGTYTAGSLTTDLSGLYIEATQILACSDTTNRLLDLVASPSSALEFIIAHYDRGTTKYHLSAYVGTTSQWTHDNGTGDQPTPFAASDRYIYVAATVATITAKVGDNLPSFTSAAKSSDHGVGNWGTWLISLDGVRWNPARYVDAVAGFKETFYSPLGNYRMGDVIKNSTTLEKCPPDDWF